MPDDKLAKQDSPGTDLAKTRDERLAELRSEARMLSRPSLEQAVAPQLKVQAAAEVSARTHAQIGHHPQYGHLAALAAASDARDAARQVDGYDEIEYKPDTVITTTNPDGSKKHENLHDGGGEIGRRRVESNLVRAPREALEQLYVDQRSEGLRDLDSALGRAGLRIDRNRVILEKRDEAEAWASTQSRRNTGMQD